MINVSIVLYNSNKQQVLNLLDIIAPAPEINRIFLIDNSEVADTDYPLLYKQKLQYIYCGKNLGYGAAHNVGLRLTLSEHTEFHLVVNSDIEFDRSIFAELEDYMNCNTQVGLLMPKVIYPNGDLQYLCKLLPTPIDLISRRFLPKRLTEKRMQRFELRNSNYDKIMNVPYLSGCFMFLRADALRKVGLFDERFFMYPEDIDLTRRIHRHFQTIFYPLVTIVHNHAKASYKSKKLLWIHVVNMCRYFNKWGWVFDSERRAVNKATLSAVGM